MRRLVAAGACVLILTACGDAGLLDGVGDRTGGFVHGNTTTTTTLPTVPAGQSGEAVVEASDVMWFNDGKISNASGEPDEVIAA
ncbi:MAG: hypothetical protein KDB69_06300, partial [Acidimicrobiia bacterium]|nr:hypothetical protein [Acidimicrobiia bacterium]